MKCVNCLEETGSKNIYCKKCSGKTKTKIKNHITFDIIRTESTRFLVAVAVLILITKFIGKLHFMIIPLLCILFIGIIFTCLRIRIIRKKDLGIKVE